MALPPVSRGRTAPEDDTTGTHVAWGRFRLAPRRPEATSYGLRINASPKVARLSRVRCTSAPRNLPRSGDQFNHPAWHPVNTESGQRPGGGARERTPPARVPLRVHGRRCPRPPHRSVRSPGQGPADLDHRPLQLPLHLLHAGGGPAVARPGRPPHLRGAGPDRPGVRGALRVRVHPDHRRRAHRPRPPAPAVRDARPPRRRPRHDHQRREAPRARRTTSRRPACTGSTSRSTRLRRETFLALTRRDELDRVLAGIDAALAAGLEPGEGQRRRDPRRQRRRGRRPRGLRARARASASASSSSCRSTPRATGPWTRWSRPRRSSSRSTPCSRSSSTMAGLDHHGDEPAARYRYRDGIGDVGVIPSVTAPFCEQLRPGPDHRRGQVPHLPVRARRVRPASRAARPTASDDDAGRGDRAGGRHEVGRPPHRQGRLHPAQPLHEPDRRLRPRSERRRRSERFLTDARTLTGRDGLGVHPPRPAGPGPHGRRHGQGRHPPPGDRPVQGAHGGRHRVEDRQSGAITKGDVLAVARVAGIQAAKQTPSPAPAVSPAARGLGLRELPDRGSATSRWRRRSTRSTAPAWRWRR